MPQKEDVAKRAVSGMIWKFSEKIGYQIISVIVQIIIARILMPEDYGVIALIMVFIALSDVFIIQGFTTALIQRKNPSQLDFSSVFYANVFISVVLYCILYLSAGVIADFYNIPSLKEITRVLALNIIFGAFAAVHNAILSRNLDFKKSFYRNISNIVCYGITGVFLAYKGYGVWSLVYARLIGTFVGSFVLILSVKWLPSLLFSAKSLKSLFKYSSKVLVTNLLKTLFYNLNSILIGKFHASSDLGYYQRGRQMPEMVMTAVDGSLSEVMYPTLSILQDDKLSLKNALRRSLKTSIFVTLPILCFLLVVAKPLTILLLTEKWLPSVPLMQLACILCMDWPLSIRIHALNALGLSGITLRISLFQQITSILMLCFTVRYGVMTIMYGGVVTSIVYILVSSHYVNKYINYSLLDMIKDIYPTFVYALLMGIAVYAVSLIGLPILIQLILQALVAIVVYFGISHLTKDENLAYMNQIIINILEKK